MAMITEAEELAVKEPATGREFAGAMPETIEETVEESLCETMEESSRGAGEELPDKVARRKNRFLYKRENIRDRIQRPHMRRMCEWLLPYVIAAGLVIGAGGAVMLVSHVGTRQLGRQLLEQYGEYFTDER